MWQCIFHPTLCIASWRCSICTNSWEILMPKKIAPQIDVKSRWWENWPLQRSIATRIHQIPISSLELRKCKHIVVAQKIQNIKGKTIAWKRMTKAIILWKTGSQWAQQCFEPFKLKESFFKHIYMLEFCRLSLKHESCVKNSSALFSRKRRHSNTSDLKYSKNTVWQV